MEKNFSKTKRFFLTVDLEEWYHLLYLKKYTDFKGLDFFSLHMDEFLVYLKQNNIKITFFVLAELALKIPKVIERISSDGHEIGCHGFNHELVPFKTDNEFILELKKAKDILEKISLQEIIGYRSPCFSLNDKKLKLLEKTAFKYDSSFIKFSNHRLYGNLDLIEYQRINSILLKNEKENFFEFQIPTTKFFNFQIPISGGGYLRIIPFFVFKKLFTDELKQRNEYMLFLHPFELYPGYFKLPINVNTKDLFRFSYGRRGNLSRVKKLLSIAKKHGYSFTLMKDELI